MRLLICILAAALLAACATPTPYQPRADGGFGYSETSIESDRMRLSFRGNSLTERETVETYLLFRAAELTLERGYDHFLVASRTTDADTRLSPALSGRYSSFSPYYRYYHPRFGWRPSFDPFWADPVEYRQITQFEASAEIVMRRGPKPAGDANAYDAREVSQNLAGRVVRPAG